MRAAGDSDRRVRAGVVVVAESIEKPPPPRHSCRDVPTPAPRRPLLESAHRKMLRRRRGGNSSLSLAHWSAPASREKNEDAPPPRKINYIVFRDGALGCVLAPA